MRNLRDFKSLTETFADDTEILVQMPDGKLYEIMGFQPTDKHNALMINLFPRPHDNIMDIPVTNNVVINDIVLRTVDTVNDILNELSEENEQLKSQIEYIIGQIKAFRDDCHTYQDFHGQSTLNRLLDILEEGKELFEDG